MRTESGATFLGCQRFVRRILSDGTSAAGHQVQHRPMAIKDLTQVERYLLLRNGSAVRA